VERRAPRFAREAPGPRAALVLSLLFAFAPDRATAENGTAIGVDSGTLYGMCRDGSPECASYIGGVIDTAILNRFLFTEQRDSGFAGPGHLAFCLPADAPLEDPAAIFVAFMGERPDEAQFSAAEGVLLAMAERYPCEVPAE
jgi:hypothetical protein